MGRTWDFTNNSTCGAGGHADWVLHNSKGCDTLATWCTCSVASVHVWLCAAPGTACSPPDSSVHGILQARILQQVTPLCSSGSFRPRVPTCVSCTAGAFFTTEPAGKPLCTHHQANYTKDSWELDWCSSFSRPDNVTSEHAETIQKTLTKQPLNYYWKQKLHLSICYYNWPLCKSVLPRLWPFNFSLAPKLWERKQSPGSCPLFYLGFVVFLKKLCMILKFHWQLEFAVKNILTKRKHCSFKSVALSWKKAICSELCLYFLFYWFLLRTSREQKGFSSFLNIFSFI